jgi:hypothetical protein
MALLKYTKKYHFKIGEETGKNPTLYPADNTTRYVRSPYVHDVYAETGKFKGNYWIEIDPIGDTDGGYLARRFWELYFDGAKQECGKYIDLGNFEFLVGAQDNDPFEVDSDSLAISYSNLYLDWDLYGLSSNIAMPSLIPYPDVEVVRICSDCTGIRIHDGSISTTGFTVSRNAGWVENPKVKFLVKGGG